jgi:hypothetical protein
MDSSDFSEKLHAARNAYLETTTTLDRMRRQYSEHHPLVLEESERMKSALPKALSHWKQVWASYESHRRLLQMDVEKAKVEHEHAKNSYNLVRGLVSKNARTEHELEAEYLKAKVAEIALNRATAILSSFEELEKVDPYLNPASIETGKRD